MYDIVYETGTCLSVQKLGHSLLSTWTKWSSYLERLDEEFIERSGTWENRAFWSLLIMVERHIITRLFSLCLNIYNYYQIKYIFWHNCLLEVKFSTVLSQKFLNEWGLYSCTKWSLILKNTKKWIAEFTNWLMYNYIYSI